MPQSLAIEEFLASPLPLLDSRSPGEFAQGRMPNALSFPLFDDNERAAVGTCYKQTGQEAAVELGLEFVGPKLAGFVRAAKQLAPDRRVRLHCWRGGMRSQSLAWLLETAGFEVQLLTGGYKSFRRWVRSTLAEPRLLTVLGGMTGTGKTALLHELAALGEQVLDLEGLANHRGSSYGALGLPPQPTQEQFDNDLAIAWAAFQPDRRVWLEAESRRIGLCRIPDEILKPMLQTPVIQVERSLDFRLELLEKIYGQSDSSQLIQATQRLTKHLGGQNANQAVEYIASGNLKPAIAIVLNYYDKTYSYDLQRRGVPIIPVTTEGMADRAIAQQLIATAQTIEA
jgi:tRNA 2-selenouridine synthase